jgi:tetratricopeptide (TPR) repeat protein
MARRSFDAGNLELAQLQCEKVLERGRRNVDALFLLSRVLNARQRYDEAARYLEQCSKLRPKNVEFHIALGLVLTDAARYGAALSRFDRALKLQPNAPAAVRGKAEVYDRRGDHARALKLLTPIYERGGDTPDMAFVYARALDREGRADDAIELLEQRSGDGRASAEALWRMLFELGRMRERREEYDLAFAAYERANRLACVADDPDAHDRLIDEIIDVFDAESLAQLPRVGEVDETPIFIIGMPRSGSTLVERIVDAHPLARGAGELPLLPEIARTLPLTIGTTQPYPKCVHGMTRQHVEGAAERYRSALRRIDRHATRVADKFLHNYEHLGLVGIALPRARVIHCRRDPMDTCLSCFASPLVPQSHPWSCDLEAIGRRYHAYERLMDHWRDAADALDIRMIELHYEELVADQEAVSRRLIEFLGLPWDDRCLRYYEMKDDALTLSREQVRRPIYKSSVGRARRFAAHLGPLREALGGPAG